jgi:hypothetical protein
MCSMAATPKERKPVPVRIPGEMVARIDALKDPLAPREAYVRVLLDKALKAEERKAGRHAR